MFRYGRRQVKCLMRALRVALGDDGAGRCGRCSVCAPADHPTPDVTDDDRAAARRWIAHRDLPIPASRFSRMAAGFTLLDGSNRTPLFVDFMRKRASSERVQLSDALLSILEQRLEVLVGAQDFAAIVALPSNTWAQRQALCEWIARRLGVPALRDLLTWKQAPRARQGELLNNDQRRDNVKGKMTVTASPPAGAVLLLDDYYGSGATLREAGRALRKDARFEYDIVPVTVARVRWRLGARGMIS